MGAAIDAAAVSPFKRHLILLRYGDPAPVWVDRALIFARCNDGCLLGSSLVTFFLQRNSHTIVYFGEVRAGQEDEDRAKQQYGCGTCGCDGRVALTLNHHHACAARSEQGQYQHQRRYGHPVFALGDDVLRYAGAQFGLRALALFRFRILSRVHLRAGSGFA